MKADIIVSVICLIVFTNIMTLFFAEHWQITERRREKEETERRRRDSDTKRDINVLMSRVDKLEKKISSYDVVEAGEIIGSVKLPSGFYNKSEEE